METMMRVENCIDNYFQFVNNSIILKYICRFFTIIFILLCSISVFSFAKIFQLTSNLTTSLFVLYITVFLVWYLIDIEERLKFSKYASKHLSRSIISDLIVILSLNKYYLTLYLSLLLISSSIFIVLSNFHLFSFTVSFAYMFLGIALGYFFRSSSIEIINFYGDKKLKNINVLIAIFLPFLIIANTFISHSMKIGFLLIGFAFGLLIHTATNYLKNKNIRTTSLGHLAIWEDTSEEKFKLYFENNREEKPILLLIMNLIESGSKNSCSKAIRLLKKHKYDLCSDETICKDPEKEYYVNLARCYLINRQFESILSLYEDALSKKINSYRLIFTSSQALCFLGKYEDSINILENSIHRMEEETNNDRPKQKKYLWLRLSESYAIKAFKENNYSIIGNSTNYLKKAIDVDPNCLLCNKLYIYYSALFETTNIISGTSSYNDSIDLLSNLHYISNTYKKLDAKPNDVSHNFLDHIVNNGKTQDIRSDLIVILSLVLSNIVPGNVASLFIKENVKSINNSFIYANFGLILEKEKEEKLAILQYRKARAFKKTSVDPLSPVIAENRLNALC